MIIGASESSERGKIWNANPQMINNPRRLMLKGKIGEDHSVFGFAINADLMCYFDTTARLFCWLDYEPRLRLGEV